MHNYFINPAHIDHLAVLMAQRFQTRGGPSAVMAGLPSAESGPSALCLDGDYGTAPMTYDVEDGTAIISVRGALVSAVIPWWFYYGDTTYEAITATVEDAAARDDVDRIFMSFYSPGGTVTGCAEAAARLYAVSEKKEIIAHCQMADSAAYWLASAANRIIVDPSGEVGSIGTIMMHTDVSEMLKKFGVDITMLFSGEHKADGWPYEPLSKAARARYQGDLDYLRGLFVQAVAEYRGLDPNEVSDTEALTYKGQQAVAVGLADDVQFSGDALRSAGDDDQVNFNQTKPKEISAMARKPKQSGKKPAAARIKKKDVRAQAEAEKRRIRAVKDAPSDDEDEEGAEGDEEDDEEGAEGDEDDPTTQNGDEDEEGAEGDEEDDEEGAEGDEEDEEEAVASPEAARIKAILGHKEASGRRKLAEHLAFNTSMTIKAAVKTLAAAPASVKKTAGNSFSSAMQSQGASRIRPSAPEKAKADNSVVDSMASMIKGRFDK